MGILDEAIREHLELKRQHGAGEPELKQLEDEAFGPPQRPGTEAPDQFGEAPTEFMAQPEAEEGASAEKAEAEPSPRRRGASRVAELQEPPPDEVARAEDAAPELQQEEEPAAGEEQEAEQSAGPSTAEREAISEQPTEYFDVEKELAEAERSGPSEEDLVDEGVSEPRLAPVDPLAGLEESDEIMASAGAEAEEDPAFEEEAEEDFFDEKRLSDELDEALESPLDSSEEEVVEVEERGEEPSVEGDVSVEAAPPEPAEEAQPPAEQASAEDSNQDVLEKTPDFLEEAPEDDELWFEQKPPKDFDFDD